MSWDPGSYPKETNLRSRATLCDDSTVDKNWPNPCATAPPCTPVAPGIANCAATVIDHYTTSFNWAQTNIAAIWLRGAWFLLDNSSITDVQNGGLTFISGGGYSRSDAPQGYWSVLKNSVLVGNTQSVDSNPYASNAGPFNPKGLTNCSSGQPAYCVSQNDGISFQGSDFAVNQRLFSIYDGPTNQYNNIYSDIHPTTLGTLSDCKSGGGWPRKLQRTAVVQRLQQRRPATTAGRWKSTIGQSQLLSAECRNRVEAAERILLSARVQLQQPGL